MSQEKTLGLSSQTEEGHSHLLAEQPQASCLPICKLGIMRVCCENQMRSHMNTLAPYVTDSKCSRYVSYNRNVRYEESITSKGQFRRALPCK